MKTKHFGLYNWDNGKWVRHPKAGDPVRCPGILCTGRIERHVSAQDAGLVRDSRGYNRAIGPRPFYVTKKKNRRVVRAETFLDSTGCINPWPSWPGDLKDTDLAGRHVVITIRAAKK